MAKNSTARYIGIVITLLVIIGGIIANFVWTQADVQAIDTKIEVVDTRVDVLKEEGCQPARQSIRSIDLIEYRLDEIQTTQRTIQQDTKEILKRLPE